MSKKKKILVGRFSSPVGLSGEIKVNFMTSTFEVFKNLHNYTNFDESIEWDFKKITYRNKKCVVSLNNCFSREEALALKGKKIYSYKKYLPATKDNEYYIEDLIGCNLIINKKNKLGKVIDVKNFGAGDLLEVKLNSKTTLIPFNKENIISVVLNKKEIIASPISGILD